MTTPYDPQNPGGQPGDPNQGQPFQPYQPQSYQDPQVPPYSPTQPYPQDPQYSGQPYAQGTPYPAGQPYQPSQYPQPMPGGASQAGDNTKLMSILAYLNLLILVPLLTGEWKKSEFVKFHTNQGLVLAIAGWGITIVGQILTAMMPLAIDLMISAIQGIAMLGIFVLMILGIIAANKGEMKPLPIVGGITILK